MTDVSGSLQILKNGYLADISGLQSLSSVGGHVVFSDIYGIGFVFNVSIFINKIIVILKKATFLKVSTG